MLDDSQSFTVTDIKQFTYCPRVIFYERCLPHIRPRTYKMDAGRDAHEEESKRAARRSLAAYGEMAGERFFNVQISSERLHLNGTIDEVVRTASGEIFPVDYKLAKHPSHHYKLQLAAYALLLQEVENTPIQRGYLYLILTRKLVPVMMTSSLLASVEATLTAIQVMTETEEMPPPVDNRNFCAACEFRRFCNDV